MNDKTNVTIVIKCEIHYARSIVNTYLHLTFPILKVECQGYVNMVIASIFSGFDFT